MATEAQRGPGGKGTSKPPTAFQIWFEDAWDGWLKYAALVVGLGLFYLLYQMEVFSERSMGLVLALGVGVGTVLSAVGSAREHAGEGSKKTMLFAFAAIWGLTVAYPIVWGIFPGAPVASAKLGEEGSQAVLQAPDGGKAIYVRAKIKGSGEIQAQYKLETSWSGGGKPVEGALSRNLARVRVGRRGSGVQVTEHNEEKHYLGVTHGPVTVKLESKDSTLDTDVFVELRRALVPPIALIVIASILFVIALALDRVIDPKGRTYLGTAAGFSLVFALYYGLDQARPSRVIGPAIGSALVAIFTGALGGAAIAWIVKKATPEKKRSGRPARA
jgi:hypothetical protein